MNGPSGLTPLILLIDDQEWTSRSIESILRPKGHVVLKAYTGQQALDLLQKVRPDALVVDINLPDMNGVELVRRLRSSHTIASSTPALMITGGAVARAERLEALAAGAWDVLTHPVDPDELILRMETYVRAKQEADHIRDEGLIDPGTGFYNARGIVRRAEEVGADAERSQRPLACIAFGPPPSAEGIGNTEALLESISERVASALRSVTRLSDTLGHLGPGEFVVVAPGTDQAGGVRLADRVLEAVEAAGPLGDLEPEQLRLVRAGLCASAGDESTTPEDLLFKATAALRMAQSDDGSFRVRAYEA
jgi:two-component system cell cycle response regulator